MSSQVWFNDGKTPKPKGPVFYEIAANGNFLHKKMPFWEAVVPVQQISILNKGDVSLKLLLPRFPVEIVKDILRFFAWIFKEHKTEVGALIWYNENTKTYRVSIPYQSVSPGSINYVNPWQEKLPGESLVASFHSHCAMEAFHSGVDEGDEMSFNGIHVTFGRFSYYGQATDLAISIEAAMNGTRFKLDPVDWLDGIEKSVDDDVPGEDGPKEALYSNKNPYNNWLYIRRSDSYRLKDGELILPDDYKPQEEWVKRVKIKALFDFGGKKYDGRVSTAGDGSPSDVTSRDREDVETGALTRDGIVRLDDEGAELSRVGVFRWCFDVLKEVAVGLFVIVGAAIPRKRKKNEEKDKS